MTVHEAAPAVAVSESQATEMAVSEFQAAEVAVPEFQAPTMEPCEFQALAVDEINENNLWRGVGMGDGPLPVRLVRLPVENISDVAVLSWRWDGDLRTRSSKNIATAVHQAKKMGVRYLFVDLVLCRVHSPPRGKLWGDTSVVNYDRCSFSEVDNEGSSTSWRYYGIFLDRTQVGLWKHKYNLWMDYDWYRFDAFPNAERVIFDALGLGEAEWEEFEGQVEARRHCLVMEMEDKVPVPKVDIISVGMY